MSLLDFAVILKPTICSRIDFWGAPVQELCRIRAPAVALGGIGLSAVWRKVFLFFFVPVEV